MLFQEEVLLVGGLGTYKVLPPIALHSLEIVTSILTNIYLFIDWNGCYENSKIECHNRREEMNQIQHQICKNRNSNPSEPRFIYQNWTTKPSELSENPELWTHEVGSTQRIKFSVYCVDHEQYIVWSIVVYLCEARGPNFQTLAFLVLP